MLIKNGTIIDGTGAEMKMADLRIEGDKITGIGELSLRKNEKLIDAKGRFVTPGFVDILNHADAFAKLFEIPSQESLLKQGITTILMGNCGSSLAPLADGVYVNSIRKWGDVSKLNVNWRTISEFFEELRRHEFGVNIATLVGHSTMRRMFAEDGSRPLGEDDIRQMEYVLEQALEQGAFGLSVGLAYAHSRDATKKELIRMANIVKKYDALFSLHIRNESEGFLEGIIEGVNIARESGVNFEFSHLKVIGDKYWNQFEDGLQAIENRDNINFDVYPYTITASVLYSFLPEWASEGGNAKLFNVVDDKKEREKLLREMKGSGYDYGDMIVAMGNIDRSYYGKSINELAKNQETTVEDTVLNLIRASNNRLIVFNKTIDEENLAKAIKHPKSFICADGVGYRREDATSGEVVHPRYFGAFPKYLHRYRQKEELLSWEEAIKKITGGPAKKIGLRNRGELIENNFADITIFDPNKIEDLSTIKDPYQYAKGIDYVIVSGEIAVEKEELKNLNGQILSRVN